MVGCDSASDEDGRTKFLEGIFLMDVVVKKETNLKKVLESEIIIGLLLGTTGKCEKYMVEDDNLVGWMEIPFSVGTEGTSTLKAIHFHFLVVIFTSINKGCKVNVSSRPFGGPICNPFPSYSLALILFLAYLLI
jgi:hypothetical protein